MPDGAMTATDDHARIVAWIEQNIGPVRGILREGRWRPAWHVDAEKDGQPIRLYVRGDRGGRWPTLPLSYEAKAQQILADGGVKVPRVYGFIEDIPAIVMEMVPGLPNIANAESDEARASLRVQLCDQMRLIHQVDPKTLAAIGAPDPKDPAELAMSYYREVEGLYLRGERLPAPDLEFIRRWLDRNVRPCPEGPAVITMDAGQFIYEGSTLTSMLDLEFVQIGDPHVDFAALRTRTRFELIGDLEQFYRMYEERGGRHIDLDRVRFHSVAFSVFTPLQVADDLARPETAADYHEYITWHVGCTKDAFEEMAELMRVELEPYELPPAANSRYALAMDAVEQVLNALPAGDDLAAYRRDKLAMAMRYLTGVERHRTQFERGYLDAIEKLTGARPADEWDGDVRLEAFVRTAGPEHDEALLRLLHRRARHQALLLDDDKGWMGYKLSTPMAPLDDNA